MGAVFLSYSSDQSDAATRIELSLKEGGHSVFRDRSSLPAGEEYDTRIRSAVEECEVFVFLLSPQSVSPGRYTLTELGFAEQKWGNPSGHVLPVVVESIPRDSIPAYLRAVTLLHPTGNLTAEVTAAVAFMTASWWRRMLAPRRLVPALVALAIIAAMVWLALPTYLDRGAQLAQVEDLVKQSRSRADEDRFPEAWKLLERAKALAPTSAEVARAEEQVAMEWLRGAALGPWSGDTLQPLVDSAEPVLMSGVNVANGARRADLLAHVGWAEYLRQLLGADGPLKTVEYYRRALDVDPPNVYAHAMWGFEMLRVARGADEAIAAARAHFAAAVATGRERTYVREVEIAALLRTYEQTWVDDFAREGEALRVANEMRLGGEAIPVGVKTRLWTLYHFDVVTSDNLARLAGALPAAEHLATFGWLFPESGLEPGRSPALFEYLHVLAQLQERAGERAAALDSYRRLVAEALRLKYDSSTAMQIINHAKAAIKRLSG